LALEKRALGHRLDRLNQSIYIQLRGCFFFLFLSCVGGGWEVRALMILKWRGPEFFRTCGRRRLDCCRLLRVFLSPLSSVSFCFIYRFIALHSYIHTRIHTHTHTRIDTQTSANPSIWLDGIPVPFPPVVVFILLFLFFSCCYIFLIVYYRAGRCMGRVRGDGKS